MKPLQELIDSGNFLIWIAFSTCFEMFISYVNILIYNQLFNIDMDKSSTEKIIILNTSSKIIFLSLFSVEVCKILEIITLILLFKIITKLKFEKCILGGILVEMIRIALEMTFMSIFGLFFDSNIGRFYSYKYFCTLISLTISMTAIYFVLKILKVKLEVNDLTIKYNSKLVIALILIGSIIYLFYIREYFYQMNLKFLIVNVLIVNMYLYIIKEFFDRLSKLDECDKKIEELEAQNKVLTSLNDSMHSIKHDFANFLLILNGYAKVNNIKEIRRMIEKEQKEFNIVNNLAMLDPKVINNPAIYSVMVNKFLVAENENVDIHIEVLTDLQNEKFETYEFYKIFSILVDNAIDAAKKCDRKYVSIKFKKDNKKNQELVIIENSFNNCDIDINRIFEKGYTTKNLDAESHGIGLWNVSRILEKNNKIDLFTSKGEMFKQQIELY